MPATYCTGYTEFTHTLMFCNFYFRSHIDVNQVDSQISHQMQTHLDLEDQIYWHEDSKPGTIV